MLGGCVECPFFDVGHGDALSELARGDEGSHFPFRHRDGLSVEQDYEILALGAAVESFGVADRASVAPTEDDFLDDVHFFLVFWWFDKWRGVTFAGDPA